MTTDSGTPLLTEALVISEVRAIADEHPDLVYHSPGDAAIGPCVYYPTDPNPYGCLIGFALSRLGVPADVLRGAYGHISDAARRLPLRCYVDDSVANSRWLSDVQVAQDARTTWAEAVGRADDLDVARRVAARRRPGAGWPAIPPPTPV